MTFFDIKIPQFVPQEFAKTTAAKLAGLTKGA